MSGKKLGFGCMRLPLVNPDDPKSIDMELMCQMVDAFLERGFTYFDTAYMYHLHQSEIALREALVKRHDRDTFTLATKLPISFLKEREDVERIFAEQQEKCGVDWFDYYLLHNVNRGNYGLIEEFDCFPFAARMKAEGKVRQTGFSYHDSAALLDEILTAHPEVDFVQLQINYIDWEDDGIQSRKCYETAVKHGKKVVVMEPVKGGRLAHVPEDVESMFKAADPKMSMPSWAIRYAASLDNVMMVLSGMSNMEQLLDNMNYMEDFVPLNHGEQEMALRAAKMIRKSTAIACTACRYCVEGCPMNIAIPEYFALYNAEQLEMNKGSDMQGIYYRHYTLANGKASDCIGCKKCENSCPQHLPVVEYLKQVAERFEKKG